MKYESNDTPHFIDLAWGSSLSSEKYVDFNERSAASINHVDSYVIARGLLNSRS